MTRMEKYCIEKLKKAEAKLKKAAWVASFLNPTTMEKDQAKLRKAEERVAQLSKALAVLKVNRDIKETCHSGRKPTQQQLLAKYRYSPKTGKLYRRDTGKEVGSPMPSGHLKCSLNYKEYYVHLIIWCMLHGYWSEVEIDHKDQDPSNNREDNLREASHKCNMQNRRVNRRSKTLVRGIHTTKE